MGKRAMAGGRRRAGDGRGGGGTERRDGVGSNEMREGALERKRKSVGERIAG